MGVAGCGGAAPRVSRPEPRSIQIVDTHTGRRTSLDRVAATLVRVRAVYVGEDHDDPIDHALELAVIEALWMREQNLAIGLEMVQAPFQGALDQWVAGRIDEAELRRRVHWHERWGFDFALYRPIFDFARDHHIPMRALNAPEEVTHAVAMGGLGALTAKQRAALPTLDLHVAAHRAMVKAALAHHPGLGPDDFEHFYEAQVIWDETMARNTARALTGPGAVQIVVVLAGRMHIERGLGVPSRAARRGARPYRTLLRVASVPSGTPPARYLFIHPGLHAHGSDP